MEEDQELKKLLISESNIYTKPTKHFILYKKQLNHNKTIYNKGFHIYYPYLFYHHFLKPYAIDNLPATVMNLFFFNTFILVITQNAFFSRILDRFEHFLVWIFFKVTRIKRN